MEASSFPPSGLNKFCFSEQIKSEVGNQNQTKVLLLRLRKKLTGKILNLRGICKVGVKLLQILVNLAVRTSIKGTLAAPGF